MLSFNELFQQSPSDVLILLFVIHIGSLVFAIVSQWALQYLTEGAEMNDEDKTETIFHGDFSIGDDESLGTVPNSSSFIDSSEIPQNNSRHEEAVFLKKSWTNLSIRKSCHQESDAVLSSVHSKKIIDHSCYQVISSKSISQNAIDQVLSSSLQTSHYAENVSNLLCNRTFEVINKNLLQSSKMKNIISKPIKTSHFTETYRDYRKKIFYENRVLETSILDLRKELEPLKYQINVLKQSLNRSVARSDSSMLTSIDTIETLSCTRSKALTTTWSSDSTSQPCLSLQRINSFVVNLNLNTSENIVPRKSVEINKNQFKDILPKRYSDPHKDNSFEEVEESRQIKRSPIAEMYVKLSQRSLQRANLSNHAMGKISQTNDVNTVKYHINLNLNLCNSSFDMHTIRSLKKQDLLPILSDMDNIIARQQILNFH